VPPPIDVKSPPTGLACPTPAIVRVLVPLPAKSPSGPSPTVARNPMSPAVVTPMSRNAA
jgi:hypothetical protein